MFLLLIIFTSQFLIAGPGAHFGVLGANPEKEYYQDWKSNRKLLKNLSPESLEQYHENLKSLASGPDFYADDNVEFSNVQPSVSYQNFRGVWMAPKSSSPETAEESEAATYSETDETVSFATSVQDNPLQAIPTLTRIMKFAIKKPEKIFSCAFVCQSWKEVIEYHCKKHICSQLIDRNPSVLLRASKNLPLFVIQMLLENGANINQQDSQGNTALHIAAARGNCHIIKMLLDHGADAEIENHQGCSAKYLAIIGKNPDSKKCFQVILNIPKTSDSYCCCMQ